MPRSPDGPMPRFPPHKLLKSFLPTTKPTLGELRMSRCFKALPLALALAALSIVTVSCGSSSNVPAQVRFVNAIQDTAQYGTALDIDVAGTKEFTDVPFPGFQPSSGYTKIVSGGSALQGIQTGTTI